MSHEPCQCYRPSSKIIGFVSGHAFRHAAQTRSSDIAPIRRSILGGSIGCGKSLNRDDSPPQGLKPSLILHDLRGAKAPLYHSAAGFRDFFRSLLGRVMAIPSYVVEYFLLGRTRRDALERCTESTQRRFS